MIDTRFKLGDTGYFLNWRQFKISVGTIVSIDIEIDEEGTEIHYRMTDTDNDRFGPSVSDEKLFVTRQDCLNHYAALFEAMRNEP